MPLTDAKIRSLKPTSSLYGRADGGGLRIMVAPTGYKSWRLYYRIDGGKQTNITFGSYPAVSLAEARRLRDEAKALLAQGIDPNVKKKEARAAAQAQKARTENTFKKIALEWWESQTTDYNAKYRQQIQQRLEKDFFPAIGGKPIADIKPLDVKAVLDAIIARGSVETARRMTNTAGQICRYARTLGLCEFDAAAGLNELLPKGGKKHYPVITDPAELGILLRSIAGYTGFYSTAYALRLLPYVFLRNSELRCGRWSEIDLEKALWTIPAERMKKRREHVVPLASQVVDLLKELHDFSGGGELLFPSPYSSSKPISDVTLRNALLRMGYQREDITVHSFRGIASTFFNEKGFRPDIIEAQLAHAEKNLVRAAYNKASYMDERRSMLQWWADYLDSLRTGTQETNIKS